MTGRVVLVTGGTRGIGRACAEAFVAEGDRVIVTGRSVPPTDPPFWCEKASPGDAFSHQNGEGVWEGVWRVACDVGDAGSVDTLFRTVEEACGPVEVVVSNAGITDDALAVRMTDEQFDGVLRTNLTGAFHIARRALRPMVRARQGRLIFISSVVGLAGQAGQANYAASKAGLVGLARSLAREYAARGITANVVAPGPVATEMLDALPPERLEAIVAAVPVGRIARPDEIAAAVSFLASPAAAMITGAVLPVDGGLAMGVA